MKYNNNIKKLNHNPSLYFILVIQGCINASVAVSLNKGSISKHLLRKSRNI